MSMSWVRTAGAVVIVSAIFSLTSAAEQAATGVTVTASKWDLRDSVVDNGCGAVGDGGCEPDYTLDGETNENADSRWSCNANMDSTSSTSVGCFITYDLGAVYDLSRVVIYFHKSDEIDREPNEFEVDTSSDGTTYTFSFGDVNVIPTALGVGESFSFGAGESGQYVRITAVFAAVDQWCSINEVEIFVDVPTPAPAATTTTPAPAAITTTPAPAAITTTPAPAAITTTSAPGATAAPARGVTSAPGVVSTPAPTGVTRSFTAAPSSVVHTSAPSVGSTEFGGVACTNITVLGAGDLDGDYTSGTASDGTTVYNSVTASATATISSGTATAVCADSSSTTACEATRWDLTPDDTSTYSTYLVYDSAVHPALITEVWFRLVAGCSGTCSNSPATVSIECGDGTTATSPPTSATSETCEIIEVTGSQDGQVDGLYYDEGDIVDDVTQFNGYTLGSDGSTLTGNGNSVSAETVDAACSGTISSSTSGTTCSFRQWWVRTASSGTSSASSSSGTTSVGTTPEAYFTYDESDHPSDILPGTWYTLSPSVVPYSVEVIVACAPSSTPPLPTATATPAPSLGDDDTRSPVVGETSSPAVTGGASGTDSDSGGGVSVAIVASAVAGGAVLLLLAAVVVYKVRGSGGGGGAPPPVPPPPTYDDLVGKA